MTVNLLGHLKTSFKDIFHHVIRLYWSDSWSINRERPTTLVFIRRQFSALVCILRRLQASSPFSGLIIKISLAAWSLQVADGPPASVQVPYGAFLKRRPVVRETESERRYSAWCKKTSRDRLEDYKRFLTGWKTEGKGQRWRSEGGQEHPTIMYLNWTSQHFK